MALTLLLSVTALLLLLAVPVHVHLGVERDRAVRARAQVSWLFGLVRFRLHPGGARTRPRKPRRARRGRGPGERIARRMAGGMLRADLRARSTAFLRDVLRAVRPRDVRLSALVGMDDPADTGRLWAVVGPLGAVLSHPGLQLEPAFDQACFRFRGTARVRLIPAQLLFLTAAFLLSPPVVRTLVAR